jgi:hypothetical protein
LARDGRITVDWGSIDGATGFTDRLFDLDIGIETSGTHR